MNLLPSGMIVNQLTKQKSFTTADGSTIRSILDATNAPVEKQSLAEASLPAGGETQRHYHKLSEEIYFMLEGQGVMEIDGEVRDVAPGDAILIASSARHQIKAITDIRFLCCCAPVYSHEDTFFDD
ncbi:MAG: cupin domain-containing protein [Rubritalea sp.]|jgi:mannose-6-phosphate isomerase-like protein (cupin superfamily)|tara:strand:+ start:220 stop:597 length:378 start_codon:yes stop_codon:yes gene_type:complete